MAKTFLISSLVTAIACAVAPQSSQTEGTPLRIGTFDSRAIAVAFAASPQHKKSIDALIAERDAARAAGKLERVQELEAEGAARQQLLHEQGFSTGDVGDLLALIKDDLPAIADRAGVDVIVSKFDVVWQRDGARPVDVTDLMVQPFQPDEKTRKNIEMVRQHEPVPLAEIRRMKD